MKKKTFILIAPRVLAFIGLLMGFIIGYLADWNRWLTIFIGLIIAFIFIKIFYLHYRKEIKELNKPFEIKKKRNNNYKILIPSKFKGTYVVVVLDILNSKKHILNLN